jgi:hypothetical protein
MNPLTFFASIRFVGRSSIKLLIAILCAVPGLQLTRAGCPANTTPDFYQPDSGSTHSYPQQVAGDRATYIRVPRVVGPGTAATLDSNGGLLNSNAEIANLGGVLGDKAYVTLTGNLSLQTAFYQLGVLAGMSTPAAEVRITFYLNGQTIGSEMVLYSSMTSPTAGPPINLSTCAEVDSSLLRFGRRLDTGGACPPTTLPLYPGETTCPGVNEIVAKYRFRVADASVMSGPGAALQQILPFPLAVFPQTLINAVNVIGSAADLTFSAAAPVVMVHGIRTDATWFLTYNPSPSGPYTNAWFARPFDDAFASYQSVTFTENRIIPGGHNLAANTDGTHPIQDAAAAFGSNRIHIVAHSMGGLWSRSFLQNELPGLRPTLQVLSLTTIDTPHHGSYNADLLSVYRDSKANGSTINLTLAQALMAHYAPDSPGSPDLTTTNVEAFNSGNILPFMINGLNKSITYMSISADANIDGSCVSGGGPCTPLNLPTITAYNTPGAPDESEGYEFPDPDVPTVVAFYNTGQKLYRQMFLFDTVTLTSCGTSVVPKTFGKTFRCLGNHVNANGGQLNDFNVTLTSARYNPPPPNPSFVEIKSFQGTSGHNHTTVGKPDVAQVVLNGILGVESKLK